MAHKFILKRSSILGKRPSKQNLNPGEIGLNTNSEDPGVFFEVSDGNVVKIGPTSVSLSPPVQFPERGESWFDLGNGTLKIGSIEEAKRVWRSMASPFLGGGGNCVFVAPEFPYSSDGLTNNGESLPFQTLTRAILELSKLYLSNVLSGFSPQDEGNRYTVFIANSHISVNNGPGKSISNFNVDFYSDTLKEVIISDLEQFNTLDGGVVVPAGVSIQGMDLKKSIMSPSYIPTYRNPLLPPDLQGESQPITSILKCSGNSYLYNFSATDKIYYNEITSISNRDTNALFKTRKPHGRSFNDKVQLTFNPQINQTTGNLVSGTYYVIPLDTHRFFLSAGPQTEESSQAYVPYSDVPNVSNVTGPKIIVKSSLKSAHRLRLVGNIGFDELGEYYTKVQKAFSSFFGGKVTEGKSLVGVGEYVIVGPTSLNYPDNETSNTVRNSSCYANQVNLRSEYGMCWGDFDGSTVEGFKSVTVNSCTCVSLQNDPCVYEIYTTLFNPEIGEPEQKWWSLTQAKFLSIPAESRPDSLSEVSDSDQLDLLNTTPINNIRYYYQNQVEAESGKSLGILDIENDFRHFGFRVRNGAYAQLQSIYTIGPAIGVWALNGGVCNLTNSTSNFGSISFKAEGFLGINSIGGANQNSKGFILEGVQRPLALLKSQVENNTNKKILSLGSKINSIYIDPADPYTQIIELSADFIPSHILPYSLKPGTALWVETEECTYRGFFVTDGGPTVITGIDDPNSFAKLRLRSSDSTIPNDPSLLPIFGIPYIRRFKDPRPDFDRSYSLFLTNTSPTAVAPQVGSVLRLNQTSQQLGTNSLRPNVQFDPGSQGGWGRVFTVDAVETGSLGSSPQFNYVIADTNQDLSYYIAITASDYSRPWYQGSDFKNCAGTYVTHKNKNWYSAENNLWDYVYYGNSSSFGEDFGPYSIAPLQPYSPFVDTSSLERQDIVSNTYQGKYAPDSNKDLYSTDTYLRGATSPYPMYATQDYYDGDDGSESLGVCLSDVSDGPSTYTVSGCILIQEEQQASMKDGNIQAKRYRPAIVEFTTLSSESIPNPRQKVSVLHLSNGSHSEFIRVISLNGTTVKGIRLTSENSFYNSSLPESGTKFIWPAGTEVTVCSTNPSPEPGIYDPYWTNTKAAIFRFFEVMGYANPVMAQFLEPKYWGERLLSMTSLSSIQPIEGYATISDRWPLEFNYPSTVIANTHTWAYTGYYTYSRGLLKYQTTDITRKLAADFQAYTLWSGRLTVTGINDKGEIVQFGPQRQALTANYYEGTSYTNTLNNQQIYEEQPFTEFPSQVAVFSVDDISNQFNGSKTTFAIKRAGLPVPPSQLSTLYTIVSLGGVAQIPFIDYEIIGDSIVYLSPPLSGLTSNIRITTSSDFFKTLKVLPLKFVEDFDGSRSLFTVDVSPESISDLEGFKATGINPENTFVFLGGSQQIPLSEVNPLTPFSYSIERTSPTEVKFTFTGPPPEGASIDIRVFSSGSYWSLRSINPVSVYSLDPLPFDGFSTSFPLTYGGLPVNPSSVSSDGLIFSLGGAIQIPNVSYKVENSRIYFLDSSDPPQPGTTCDLRLIANAEFISCGINYKYGTDFLSWGPGIVLSLANESGMLN